MSYDVAFSLDNDPPSPGDLREFFRGRRWYDVEDSGAEYTDIDTGVTFQVGWDAGAASEQVTFSLQEGRPRIYGREAAEELEAFADAFSESLAEPFDAEQCRSDWEKSNREAVAAAAGSDEDPVDGTVDDATLEAAWRWNRVRRELMEKLGGSMFVPRILFFQDDEGIRRGVVWPDAVPMAIPEVDFVLVSVPEQAAPSQDASRAHRVSYEEFVERASSVAEDHEEPVPHRQLQWTEAPTDFVEEVTGEEKVAEPDDLTGLAIDRIFEASLLRED